MTPPVFLGRSESEWIETFKNWRGCDVPEDFFLAFGEGSPVKNCLLAALVDDLYSDVDDTRLLAIRWTYKLRELAKPIEEDLMLLLSHEDYVTRLAAILSVYLIRADDVQVIPLLEHIAGNDENHRVRKSARSAVYNIKHNTNDRETFDPCDCRCGLPMKTYRRWIGCKICNCFATFEDSKELEEFQRYAETYWGNKVFNEDS